jgi:hypothetical protein
MLPVKAAEGTCAQELPFIVIPVSANWIFAFADAGTMPPQN